MRRAEPESRKVRLRAADAFELIRWLARSQSDPRKAVAELVQNSLDAGARHIRLLRHRRRGVSVLSIEDDGEGVIPEMGREEALRYLATHVGHSRKLGLTPQERAARVVAGQYGVGLLGFWAIGRHLELRTRVKGSELWALRLTEDDPKAVLARLPPRLDAPETYTEVVVAEHHAPAQRILLGRRLADYLAAELRGQLLGREVDLTIHDGVVRGLAQKDFAVVPRRYVGERLVLPPEVPVEGFPSLRVELYLGRGVERPALQVACAGTLVSDDIAELGSLGVDGPPWIGRGLSGILDFAGFHVPPGSRRGVLPDKGAAAFVRALERLQPLVEAELSRFERERAEAADRDVVREVRRALRGLRQRLPQYDLPAVSGGGDPEPEAPGEGEPLVERQVPEDEAEDAQLFPPGSLATVRIRPDPVRVPRGGERRVTAIPEDEAGRRIREGITFRWSVSGEGLALRGEGARPAVAAPPRSALGEGTLTVAAERGGARAQAQARVAIVDQEEDEGGRLGIPEPEQVREPGALWRSRMLGDRWQINNAHEDYVALQGDPKGRVRYVLSLYAKEIVHRTYGKPGDDTLLERLVEILAHAERNLRGS